MATCTCDCCNPDTPTTLNYTTKEINQILADGVINASVRYAPVGQAYISLTLADALALVPDNVNWSEWEPISGGGSSGESPVYYFPGDPSKLDSSVSSTHITSTLGTASDLLDAFNNGKVFISKTVTFSGVQVPSDITYSLLKSEDPDTPTVFQIIMSTVVWGHYIEITIDFENNEYQAISNTINGIIGVNNTGTTN